MQLGLHVDFHEYADLGHSIDYVEIEDLAQWLLKHFPGNA